MKYILLIMFLVFSINSASAENVEREEFVVVIKDHVFVPAEVIVPAEKKIKLIVDNQDVTPEEFESHELHREKIIQGGQKGVILLGPLKAGDYKFFGEFHQKTAQGILKVQ